MKVASLFSFQFKYKIKSVRTVEYVMSMKLSLGYNLLLDSTLPAIKYILVEVKEEKIPLFVFA